MAEQKYIAVDPNDGRTDDLVYMTNPKNKFVGEIVSVNPDDDEEKLDVRDLFVAHVKVDGKNIEAYTDNSRRIVDISPHVELNPVSVGGGKPIFTDWECMPPRTPDGDASEDNPHPNKRLSLRMRDDGKWVVVLVLQEADEEQGIEEQTIDLTCGKGGTSSLELKWFDPQINYGCLTTVSATRQCNNLLGYRLGVEDGLNEGKLLQPAADEASDEPYFRAWKNGCHPDGLCAGEGAQAYVYDHEQGEKVIVQGGIAFGKNAKVTKEGAVQIGEGTNSNQDTLQFRDYQLVDNEGHIPNERIVTDTTLTIEGAAADAAAVGRYINGNYVPFVKDKDGEKTAVTIGNRLESSGTGESQVVYEVGKHSLAQGTDVVAQGDYSHAEGYLTKALGYGSHADGCMVQAKGEHSHAEGWKTITTNTHEHAEGTYNHSYTANLGTIHSIGIGQSEDDRKNAIETLKNGKHYILNVGGYDGKNPTGSSDVATVINKLENDVLLNMVLKSVPSKYEGYDITFDIYEENGVFQVRPMVNGGAVGIAKQITKDTTRITWNVDGDDKEWDGDEQLVAKIYYVLGEQDKKPLQPAGDYLLAEDFNNVEVGKFMSRRIIVKDGGEIQLQPNSSINIDKTNDETEAKILVNSNGTLHELSFPAKTGTIAVLEDISTILSGQTFDVTSSTDVQKALGAIITALGGTATNVPA